MNTRNRSMRSIISSLFILVTFLGGIVLAQQASETVAGKRIKSALWNRKDVRFVEGELAVKVRNGLQSTEIASILSKTNASLKRNFDALGWGLLELPKGKNELSTIAEVRQLPFVLAVEPNLITKASYEPNDPYYRGTTPASYAHQWALKNTGQSPPGGSVGADIHATGAWDLTTGSSNVIIAVLDSGIPILNGSLSHPDLDDSNKMLLGPDYIDQSGTEEYSEGVRDRNGHGTHVAGIAAAETNNSTGIAGVAGNSKILVIQVFDDYGNGTWDAIYNGVVYAVDYQRNNAGKKVVINLSGGGDSTQQALDAVAYANTYGVPVVAAAGNRDGGDVIFPAALSPWYQNVIAVSSTDHTDTFSSFSSQGPQVVLCAPGGWGSYVNNETLVRYYNGVGNYGQNIFSTTPNYPFIRQEYTDLTEAYGYLAGTSMATPHVSGVIALMLSVNPSLSPSQIRTSLQLSVDKVSGMGQQNFTDQYGYGRVNADKSVHNLYVPDEFSTLESALSSVASGQTIFVNDNQTITGSYTIPSGVTIKMNSGTRIIVYGSLTANGTSGSHVTLDGQGYSRASYVYPLVLTAYGGTANFQYTDFKNAAYELTTWYTSDSAICHPLVGWKSLPSG